MFTLIENGDVYAPDACGTQAILLAGEKIARIGAVDRRALEATGLGIEIINAAGCIVIPGLIDPHEHLIGGSGEAGFATQTPEIGFRELVGAGITTVVGCLGVDTTTKTMPGLLAKAKGLQAEGLTAFIYSGGYDVPPVTLTGSVRNDLIIVNEVIGAGEVAISDRRSTEPSVPELARLVRDSFVGGLLSGKAGITHFHVGEGKQRLKPVRTLLEEHEIEAPWLYLTHVERNEPLMLEAVEVSHAGVTVDIDTVEGDLARWLQFYMDNGGDMAHLTVSSDAAISSPATLWEQLKSCITNHGHPIELVVRLATANTAAVLGLLGKGKLQTGCDADIAILEKGSFELRDVIARGKQLLRDGQLTLTEAFLEGSNRRIDLHGTKQHS